MFTPGPSRKCAPWAFASLPISVPTRSASAGFHVAAKAIPPAKAVAGPKLRTPTGPSAIFRRGNPSRGRARIKKSSTPPSMSIFSSSPAEDSLDPELDVTRRGRGRLREGLYPDEENNCDRRANLSHGTQRGKPPHRFSVPGHLIISDAILRLVRRESSVSCFASPQVLFGAGRVLSHFRRQGGPTFSSAHEKPGIGLLACVADTPNGIGAVIRHHQRTVLGDSDSNGSAPDPPLRRHETGEKVLVFPACAAVLQRHANYLVPCAHSPVPRAMLRGEDISPIFRRELLAVVKCHLERGIMGFDENIGHDNLVF